MKLLRIRIENLNSLYGVHEIDLERDLGDAPLFLIVGPTGAGKSTILDAVALALFGQTPRLGKPRGEKASDEDCRHAISRGTAFASAQVELARARDGRTERWRATWQCQRARRRPDGAPQDPRRVLEKFDPASGTWREVVSDTREKFWRPAFDELLDGLTVEDFQRSVLLAQGEFAAFLEASEDERAAILERLTDTALYRELGARANRRRQEAERALAEAHARLAGVAALPAEKIDRLREAAQALEAEVARRRGELFSARILRDELTAAARAIERARAEAAREEAEIASAREIEAGAKAALAALEKQARGLAEERERRAAALREAAPEIARARALRARLAEAERADSEAAGRAAKAAKARAARQEAVGEAEAALAEAARRLERALSEGRADLARIEAESAAAGASLVGLLEAAERARAALAAALEGAPDARTRRAMLREREAEAARRAAALAEARRLLCERSSIEKALAGRDAVIAADSAEANRLAEAIEERAARRDEIAGRLAERRAELDDRRWFQRMARERGRLRENEECPLCGATDHPYARDERFVEAARRIDARCAALEAEIARDEADLRAAEREIASLDRERAAALARRDAGRTQAEVERRAVETKSEAFAAIALALGLPPGAGEADLAQAAGAAAAQAEAAAALGRALDEAEARARNAEDALAAARARLDGLGAAEATIRGAIEGAPGPEPGEAGSAADARPAAAAIEAGETPLGRTLRDRGATPVALAAAARATAARADAARRAYGAARERCRAERALLATALELERDALGEANARRAELEALRRDAAGALGGAQPDSIEAALRAALEEAARAIEDAMARRAALSRDLAEAESRCKAAERRLDSARAEIAAAEARLTPHLDGKPAVPEELAGLVAALDARTRAAESALDEQRAAHADLVARLGREEEARARAQHLAAECDRLSRENDLWQRLHDLIGVGEGAEFQRFAQVLNLEDLIGRANAHLARLAPRYELAPARGPRGEPRLAFAVRDAWQASEVRPITTLSGGEKFLASLALALALAGARAVRMPIETLLIDEGFGALGPKALEVAMRALEALHAGGAQIGIVSHIDALRERIDARIVVEELGGGRSRVRVESGRPAASGSAHIGGGTRI